MPRAALSCCLNISDCRQVQPDVTISDSPAESYKHSPVADDEDGIETDSADTDPDYAVPDSGSFAKVCLAWHEIVQSRQQLAYTLILIVNCIVDFQQPC